MTVLAYGGATAPTLPCHRRCFPTTLLFLCLALGLSLLVPTLSWAQAPAPATSATAPSPDKPVPKLDASLCQIETRPAVEGAQDKAAKKKARGHIAAAGKAYASYDFVGALRELRSAYELDPQNDVLYNIAQACREGGVDVEALKLYEFLIRQNPEPALKTDSERHIGTLRPKIAKSLDERALDQLKNERFEQAATLWDQAHKLDGQPLYLFRQANALRLAGQGPEALLVYERFVATGPNEDMLKEARGHMARLRAKSSVERAKNHTRAEEHTQAMAAWQAAYEQDPRELYIFEIAESARRAGLINEAQASYTRFLRESAATDYSEQRKQAETQLAQIAQQREQQKRKETPIYKRPWFWGVMGGIAAVVITTAIVVPLVAKPVDLVGGLPADRQRTLVVPKSADISLGLVLSFGRGR
ncbi:MAG TPA: tetratricopeptide repeat protein [Pseudomonadota bacterium]|nr:tetratricopeptide repeat protein [Pseudomonadota bacterium]